MILRNSEIANLYNTITNHTIIFFDMDGTLVDTDLTNFLAYKKAIEVVTTFNIPIYYQPDKRLTRNSLNDLIPNLTEAQHYQIIQKKEEYYAEFLSEAKPINEAIAFLINISKTNKTILVTKSRKERAIATLKHFELGQYFDRLFYSHNHKNELKTNKFHDVIMHLAISPLDIVAFENDDKEIIEAQNAGIPVIVQIIKE